MAQCTSKYSYCYSLFVESKNSIFFVLENHSSLIVSGDVDLESNAWWNMDDIENEYNTHHYERLKKLCLSDPVHTIVLKSYIESQVKQKFIFVQDHSLNGKFSCCS